MEYFIKQVEDLIAENNGYMIDVEENRRLRRELNKLAEPFQKQLKVLEKNEFVKQYIEASKKVDYVHDKGMHLISYLPK